MFTGIIEAIGSIRAIEDRGADRRLFIEAGKLDLAGLRPGDSIAVNGACLSVVEVSEKGFAVDVSVETLSCTTFGSLSIGAKLNLERAMRLSDRLNGHLLAGHVDGVGMVRERRAEGRSEQFVFEAPAGLMRFICRKGAIAVDGVSLTVNTTEADSFGVNIIPHTLTATTFGDYRPGTPVNLEVDLIARYLESLFRPHA